jgi:hypothetical protein
VNIFIFDSVEQLMLEDDQVGIQFLVLASLISRVVNAYGLEVAAFEETLRLVRVMR